MCALCNGKQLICNYVSRRGTCSRNCGARLERESFVKQNSCTFSDLFQIGRSCYSAVSIVNDYWGWAVQIAPVMEIAVHDC